MDVAEDRHVDAGREQRVDRGRHWRVAGIVDRFLALPVIWRSGVAAALVLLVVLVAEDYIWPMADDWNAQANRIEKIIDQAHIRLPTGGSLLIELSPMIADRAAECADTHGGYGQPRFVKDLAGHRRILCLKKS